MKDIGTFFALALILAIGIGMGYAIRAWRMSDTVTETIVLEDGSTIEVTVDADSPQDGDPLPESMINESAEDDASNILARETVKGSAITDEELAADLAYEESLRNKSKKAIQVEGDASELKPLQSFTLTERNGKEIKSEDLQGTPYVVSFFYSQCPSICVKQNSLVKELQAEFANEKIRFLSITVDPENDTPEALREYAARFGADAQQWLFLTGELNYIRRVSGEVFQVYADRQVHVERFLLIDRDGQLEGSYDWSEPRRLEKLKQRIREMLEVEA